MVEDGAIEMHGKMLRFDLIFACWWTLQFGAELRKLTLKYKSSTSYMLLSIAGQQFLYTDTEAIEETNSAVFVVSTQWRISNACD